MTLHIPPETKQQIESEATAAQKARVQSFLDEIKRIQQGHKLVLIPVIRYAKNGIIPDVEVHEMPTETQPTT